jgi:isoaspartyl peptidase/L-asparaginase-like protein (Ntn-hydrolase superfamily)
MVMEDDPRFNAGTGSRVRLDLASVQMDASVMRSDGRFGAVAGVENVKNPVRVARAVMDSPHRLIAGDGATRFARTLGMPYYDPRTPEMRASAEELRAQLVRRDPTLPKEWLAYDWRARWNYALSLEEAGVGDVATPGAADAGHDTVGVAVRTKDGRFGVALSTGGTSITLRGRVGDVPILGAGLFAGDHGASAATGIGERIIDAGLSRKVHDWLAAGSTAKDAAERAVREAGGEDIGIIVIDPLAMAAAADRSMAWAGRESGSTGWLGPN